VGRSVQRKILKRLSSVRDTGCGLLTILLITLPVWVMTLALRGPVFALGALVVLGLVVFGIGWLNKMLGEDRH
jgi:hypothetical protein